jgi:hypothetical protein
MATADMAETCLIRLQVDTMLTQESFRWSANDDAAPFRARVAGLKAEGPAALQHWLAISAENQANSPPGCARLT